MAETQVNENYTKTVIEMDRFLASLGYLKGELRSQNKPDEGDGK
jgi:hypothetical protein